MSFSFSVSIIVQPYANTEGLKSSFIIEFLISLFSSMIFHFICFGPILIKSINIYNGYLFLTYYYLIILDCLFDITIFVLKYFVVS